MSLEQEILDDLKRIQSIYMVDDINYDNCTYIAECIADNPKEVERWAHIIKSHEFYTEDPKFTFTVTKRAIHTSKRKRSF